MRTVYATTLEVRASADVSAALDYVGRWIHDWYKRQRLSVEVLENLTVGDLLLEPAEGHRLSVEHHSAVSEPGATLVDIQWTYPDQYDKSLGWVVSLALFRANQGLTLSLELAVTGLQLLIAPANIKLGSPRLIRDVSRLRSVFISGHPYNDIPEAIGAEEVEALVAELTDESRPYPVMVVSKQISDDRPLFDISALAERLAGVGKVYELADKWAAFRLTEVLSKPLSCYGGAVRLYWPRFSVESNPFVHPLWMPWQFKDEQTLDRTLTDIAGMAFDAAGFRHIEPLAISRLRQASEREQREANRTQSSSSADKLLEDLVAVEVQLSELQRAHADLLRENETLRGNAMVLAAHAGRPASSTSMQHGSPAEVGETSEDTDSPKTVVGAIKLAEVQAKNLKFLESAYSSAEESPFRHPDRALQALSAIDEVASIWAESIGTGKSVGSIRHLFKRRGFDYADDVSQTSRSKWGGEYEATYNGRQLDISPHITIGAKQADSCLSVHWAWDKDERKALIAHVGRHKTNTKS